jgi:hypothetical protein
VPKYRLSNRRAQIGVNGYAALYSSPQDRARNSLQARRAPTPLRPVVPSGRAKARADAAARRRLVMTVLLSALALPALVALATGSTAAWWVVVGLLPVVCTYVAVLFRARRLMAEKEFNVAFLGGSNLVAPGLEDIFAGHREAAGASYGHLSAVSAGSYR